jgi:maltose O-acetyltransferase
VRRLPGRRRLTHDGAMSASNAPALPTPHRRIGRALAAPVYWSIGHRLPWSPRPGGAIARRIRGALARRMLDECGVEVNIEKGARFGSGKGVRVGNRSALGLDCLVIGPLVVGDDVMMGPRCCMLGSSHATASTDVPMNQQGFLPDQAVVIEDDVWIGANVTVLPGRTIGRGSIVGAGAVVTRDVPPYSVVGGNPAQVVASRTDRVAAAGRR